ncbi:LysR family transcriptional regulator [Pseudoroseicyclus tamaricis]|uniref:LysR family transcriptional regulator n=1 Tax=Pseudoroseicyclus tamaricis TaxID=2705421 RepID=A0A6B2JV67_9RHOB|nr:LysR family transcriptional regulator [Pseudoroseicyclus tamaricis]NDV02397.1 LysR family transcriptional regulator [Pseudoroseicyclus tamaricis]
MKFDERQLVQIAAIVKHGSATEAAKALGVSQPSISRTVAQLEQRLGEPLFVKGRRPLTPTPLGEIVAQHGLSILTASRKVSDAVTSYRQGNAGVVRLGGVPFFLDAIISRTIATYNSRHPDVRVDQSYGNLGELTGQLEADFLDLALTPLGQSTPPDGFEFIPLLRARNVIAARKHHPLMQKSVLSASDVTKFPWVAPLPGSPLLLDLHWILLTLGSNELAIRYSGGSLMSVINYLSETDALAILPHSVVFAMRHENKVGVVPLDVPQPKRVIGILTAAGAPMAPAVKRMADHIQQEFASMAEAIERHERTIVWG